MGAAATTRVHARPGVVRLVVSALDRAVAFYQDAIGLRVHGQDGGEAALGDGATIVLELEERPGARPPGRHAGLFHVALLLPDRAELAHALRRVAAARAHVDGLSDHGTHEAVYLADPDGNGLELAADRPREQWPEVGGGRGYIAGPAPLDVESLIAEVGGRSPTPRAAEGVRVGHVHLCVSELAPVEAFWTAGLGLEVKARLPSAVFAAAGDYHHHVAGNVWRGRGVPPSPPDAAGLRFWTLELPEGAALDDAAARLEQAGHPVQARDGAVWSEDPSGIVVRLTAA